MSIKIADALTCKQTEIDRWTAVARMFPDAEVLSDGSFYAKSAAPVADRIEFRPAPKDHDCEVAHDCLSTSVRVIAEENRLATRRELSSAIVTAGRLPIHVALGRLKIEKPEAYAALIAIVNDDNGDAESCPF